MRHITSLFIGAIIVAWAAYLSWPMSSDFPASTGGTATAPTSRVKAPAPACDIDVYEVNEPKSGQPSA